MNKKRFYYAIIAIMFAVIATILIGESAKTSHQKAKFNRNISKVVSIEIIGKNEGYTNIISITKDSSVFLNKDYTGIIINKQVKSVTNSHYSYSFMPKENPNDGSFFVLNGLTILNNQIFSFNGNYGEIYIRINNVNNFVKVNFHFNNPVLIDEDNFVFRMNSIKEEFLFGKFNLKTKTLTLSNLNNYMPFNGNLATDGVLVYDKKKWLYFINYYTSKVIKFDTALNVQKTFKTIDGSEKLPEITYLPKVKTYQFSSPKRAINDKSAVIGNRLYVVSGLLALNEHNFYSKQNHRIDSYDTESGNYLTSYYLSKKYGGVIIDMVAFKKNELSMLTNKHLIKIMTN